MIPITGMYQQNKTKIDPEDWIVALPGEGGKAHKLDRGRFKRSATYLKMHNDPKAEQRVHAKYWSSCMVARAY